jgi:hypothetical protein
MKELDLLKKDWKKNDAFEQVSEQEIYTMLLKKSSSVVKWILIVSILEFVVLNGIGYLLPDPYDNKYSILHPYLDFAEKLNYIIILGFIYLFYRNYKAISVLESSKTLIEHILKTRKIVTYYIYWNIIVTGYIGAFSFIDGFNYRDMYTAEKLVIPSQGPIMLIILLISMLFIMGLLWMFYKLLYGGFLRKLKENHNELKKIDL